MGIQKLYVGTYTSAADKKGGEGIYVYDFNSVTGEIVLSDICRQIRNPSFLTIGKNTLYAVEELFNGSNIVSYNINCDGSLTLNGRTTTSQGDMCHLLLWPDGQHITGSNFASGSLVTCDIMEDGRIGPVSQCLYHEGNGPGRMQDKAHVHSATLLPDKKHMLVCDLGSDTLTVYRMDSNKGELICCQQVRCHAGDGPRHADVSPDGKQITVLSQLSSMLLTYELMTDGCLGELISRVPMLPESFDRVNDAADVHYSPDGRHVYASNRGHDSIVVCDVLPNGALTNPRHFPCYGKEPRNFCLSADGKIIVIANQATGNVVTASVDTTSGALQDVLCKVTVPQAVFVALA